MEELTDTNPAHDLEITPLPSASRLPSPRHSRRLLSGVASVAAVLVLALFASLIFANRPHSDKGTGNTAGSQTFTQTALSGISMVSPDEGWAVGSATTITISTGAKSNAPSDPGQVSSHAVLTAPVPAKSEILLYHFKNGAWTQVHVQLHISGLPHLTAISMDSPTDGWAVGGAFQDPSSASAATDQTPEMHAILLHYDGSSWRQVSSAIQAVLGDVHMLSATSGWALTEGTQNQVPEILHYDGTAWTAQALPASLSAGSQHALNLTNLTTLADGEVWVTGIIFPSGGSSGSGSAAPSSTAPGQSPSGQPPLPTSVILRYVAGGWSVQATIANALVNSIAMAAPDDGWAIGQNFPVAPSGVGQPPQPTSASSNTLFLRYSGGHWTRVTAPLAADTGDAQITLTHISLLSPTDGWITGMAEHSTASMVAQGSSGQPSSTKSVPQVSLVLLHYDGTQWRSVGGPSLPAHAMPNILDADFISSSEGWAVGTLLTFPLDTGQVNPAPLYPDAAPLVLHYSNGTWSMYKLPVILP